MIRHQSGNDQGVLLGLPLGPWGLELREIIGFGTLNHGLFMGRGLHHGRVPAEASAEAGQDGQLKIGFLDVGERGRWTHSSKPH